MTLTDIPQDLREELAVLADLLPEQSPLPYAKARLLVLSWTRLGEDALAWAGANLVMKIARSHTNLEIGHTDPLPCRR